MTASITFADGTPLSGTALNTVIAELWSAVSDVGNEQLAPGSITHDKLLDNAAIYCVKQTLLPETSSASFVAGALAGFALPAVGAPYSFLPFQPLVRPGWQGFLCGILVQVAEADVAGANPFTMDFRRNGTTDLNGQPMVIDQDDATYAILKSDPIGDPLCSMGDGDYIEARIWDPTGGPPARPRGVNVLYIMKHVLVPGG